MLCHNIKHIFSFTLYNNNNRIILMKKNIALQEPYLNILRKEKVPVSIYLISGIKLQGQIESFDQFVILLKNTVSQMVYKHAISTIVPSKNIHLTLDETNHNGN